MKPRAAAPRPHHAILVALATSLLCFVPQASNAQSTRAEAIRLAQAEKQKTLRPPQPNRAEVVIARLKHWSLMGGVPRGPYPWFGSVHPGGGFAAGAGLRQPFGDDGALNAFGGYSLAGFSRGQADLELPTFAAHRARLTLSARYVDAPDVRFFGTGNASRREDLTRFGYTPAGGGALLAVRAGEHLTFGGGVNYLDVRTSPGKTTPSIGDRFTTANTPGLDVRSFAYVNSTARLAFDSRGSLGYSGKGGLYRLQFDGYREREHGRYSFRMMEAELLQLVPILRANWVIALRGVVTMTDADQGHAAPYFLMPALGGGATLRGYPDFRFRDRHRLLLNGELRWTPARFLDMAIFYDAGKVASRRADLDLDGLKNSYGIGMRLIGLQGYAFRLEIARSREHSARILFGAGGAF